jgi:serine/threonine protein phosphatase PrpC
MALFRRLTARAASLKEPEFEVPSVYRLVGSMLSHPGKVRTNNEDTVTFALPTGGGPKGGGPEGDGADTKGDALLLVADGMGGHAAGEVASRIAADVFHRCFFAEPGRPIHDVLVECFDTANAEIFEAGQNNPEYAGMGTTCTAIAVRNNRAWLAHVGDSRAYMMREDDFHQISEDHTLVAELVRRGSLTHEEAAVSPERNVILKALGTAAHVAPNVWDEGMPLRPDDRFLLCSDGLSDLVADTVMKQFISTLSPIDACSALIDAALDAGGHDNVSVGVFHLTVPAEADVTETIVERPTRRTEDNPIIELGLAEPEPEPLRATRRTEDDPIAGGSV